MNTIVQNDRIQLFEDKRIRTAWDEEKEEWYFSVIDVVAVLTDQPDYQAARNYWKVTKKRLKDEGNETVTACNQLKMTASDGKKRLTDVADTEQLLRIIQSIPSPKAEPFKLWLAQVGRERIEETIDPELTIDRALETYLKKGYSREWINQRLQAIQVRKELTDEWDARGVQKGVEYAILTDEISRAWSGMSTRQYKNLKGLKKENLRDNMTTLELVLNMLAKTLDISAISFHKVIQVARKKDALNDWGSIVALTYIAAQRTLYGYNDMADAKALLESIARSFGYIYGREKHVRINTVSQSPTPTTAGSGVLGMGDLMNFAENMSPLGNASATDCADYVLTLFSDLTRKVTMQNLYHDGGFASMGMSRRAMKTYEKGLRFDDVHQNQYPFGDGEK